MPFSCFTPDGSSDLCFEGGSCVVPGALACDCPPGWGHDYSFWHDNNCALPDGAYLWNLVGSSVVTALCLFAVVPKMRVVRKRVRTVAYFTIANLVSLWLIALGTYLQDGWAEASSVLHFVQLCIYSAAAFHVMNI